MLRPPRSARVLALFAPLLALVASCSSDDGRKPPRLVVLYASCSLNKDYLAPYDSSVRFTPNFARFAEEAVVFERHVTEAGQSGISFASLFSGVQAYSHGAYRHPVRLGEHLHMVTEVFAGAGYETFFWSGQRMGSVELNYGQGVPPGNAWQRSPKDKDTYTANDAQFRAILDKLEADPDYRAFVLINLTLSHSPYHLYATKDVMADFIRRFPDEMTVDLDTYERMIELYADNRLPLQWNFRETVETLGLSEDEVDVLAACLDVTYRACIWKLDEYFGRWLDSIEASGQLDDSLIAFTSDHGEILRRENAWYQWTHGLQLAPEVLDVAFLLRGPAAGVRPQRYGEVTRSVDVLPTMAGLCGIGLPEDAPIEGTNLAPALRGAAPPPRQLAYSHTTTLGPDLLATFADWKPVIERNPTEDVLWNQVRVRDRDMVFKWLQTSPQDWNFVAYDLAKDPGETRDVFDASNPAHVRMGELLRDYKELLTRGYLDPITSPRMPTREEELEVLKGLGYVGD